MSADNGVYILQSKDGFRVTHAQAIENLYWWYTDFCLCGRKDQHDKDLGHCKQCGEFLFEEREELNPEMIKEYFGDSKVFSTKQEALNCASETLEQQGFVEYGISFIRGWEDKIFPI